MKRTLAGLGVVMMLTLAVVTAQAPNPEIARVAEQYQSAFNKGDVKAVMMLYTDSAWRVTPAGEFLAGRAAIEKSYQDAFGGPLKGARLTLQPGRVQQLSSDTALIEGTFELTGGSNPLKGQYLNTIVRQGGHWRLASVATVPVMAGGGR